MCLPLAACAQDAPEEVAADADDLIECALDGAASFVRNCVIEVSQANAPPVVTIRHPDGGFRRFEWISMRSGPALQVADGVSQPPIEQHGEIISIAVDSDRYRIPIARSLRVDD